MNTIKYILKVLLISIGVVIVIIIGFFIYFLYIMGGFDTDYSVTELKQNFNDKKSEIYEVKRYFTKIVPKDKFVVIEFDSNTELARFHISYNDTTMNYDDRNIFRSSDLKINTVRTDSVLNIIGWNNDILKELKNKLDNANCIGISGTEPATIDFQRSGMAMYSFIVFDNPIPENIKEQYNDSCTYIYVNDKLVLEYGSGVLGSQCFYKLD